MRIRVKLMGMLKSHAPAEDEVELPESATIDDLLRALEIDPSTVQAFSRNGQIVRNRQEPLCDGDEITILPPVGGG